MEQQLTHLEEKAQKGKISLLNIVAFLAILGLIIVGSYLKYQETIANREIQKLDKEITSLTQEIDTLQKRENISAVYIAQNGLSQLKEKEIFWSEFIKKLHEVTPKDIFYRSYAGNENKKISLSTIAKSFEDAANIIKILKAQSVFKDVFVPSISLGTDLTQAQIATFNIELEYEQEKKRKITRPTQ